MAVEQKQETAQSAEKPINLTRLLRYWQRRLRLADWKVTIQFVRADDPDMAGEAQGHCEWDEHPRTALIKILDPRDYTNSLGIPQDIEDTVVHELLHLHLCGWNTKNKAELVKLEQAIESISGALVSLKRRTKTTA